MITAAPLAPSRSFVVYSSCLPSGPHSGSWCPRTPTSGAPARVRRSRARSKNCRTTFELSGSGASVTSATVLPSGDTLGRRGHGHPRLARRRGLAHAVRPPVRPAAALTTEQTLRLTRPIRLDAEQLVEVDVVPGRRPAARPLPTRRRVVDVVDPVAVRREGRHRCPAPVRQLRRCCVGLDPDVAGLGL